MEMDITDVFDMFQGWATKSSQKHIWGQNIQEIWKWRSPWPKFKIKGSISHCQKYENIPMFLPLLLRHLSQPNANISAFFILWHLLLTLCWSWNNEVYDIPHTPGSSPGHVSYRSTALCHNQISSYSGWQGEVLRELVVSLWWLARVWFQCFSNPSFQAGVISVAIPHLDLQVHQQTVVPCSSRSRWQSMYLDKLYAKCHL